MKDTGQVVLVIEDIDSNMKLLCEVLEPRGYNILLAKNGMDGWRLASEHRPDLILMDIQLPDVSGLEVTKWLKADETLKSIPIVAVTAFALEGDEQLLLDGGCDAYISKPISIPYFLQTVERALAGERPGSADREIEPRRLSN